VIIVLRSAVVDWNYVLSGSMSPTVQQGDCILVNKLAYDLKIPLTQQRLVEWSAPERGDVVLLRAPDAGDLLVKRVIGRPGDQIELRNNILFVNDEPATHETIDRRSIGMNSLTEDDGHEFIREKIGTHLHPVKFKADQPATRSFGPVTVPDDRYFVLGDNRDESIDSRSFGFVARDLILGRATAIAVAAPLDKHASSLVRRRFFRRLS
jgi:signal peptidase I